MRFAPSAVATLALTFAALAAHAQPTAWLVAQLASTDPAAGALRAATAPDAAAIARATGPLAALGLRVHGALLARAGASAGARPGPLVPGFAPERVVLLAAADSAHADAARAALVGARLVDWVEPLLERSVALVGYAPAGPPAAFRRSATLDSLPNDPLLRSLEQWGVYNVGGAAGGFFGGLARADAHALEAWHTSVGADGVKLAVADTGIDPAQPELGGLLADGTQRIVDALNVTGEPVPAVTDSFGHGTPVAGVMAARTNDGPHFSGSGVAGVCGGDGVTTAGCRIVPIKIAPGHSGDATSFDIAAAAIHAADVGARAMNLSFAGSGASRVERLALTYALVRGCVVVAAAGNLGTRPNPRLPQYPAAYAADGLCIQVGASDPSDARVVFSSYGPGLDLVAPGVNIWTTFMSYPSYAGAVYDGYVAASGTSFAAPFVTGAVGLLAAARPELTDVDFQHILRESAHDVGAPGVDEQTGWGRLDLGAALAAVRPELGIWHDEVAAQSVIADTTAATLLIGEHGPGTLDRLSGDVAARRYAALATVTLPDSFVDSVRVWPRVGGTLAARGDYQLPYFTPTAQVIARTDRTFTLRGWLYRATDDTCATCPESWIPLPPEYVRFGFTVIGRVARGHIAAVAPRADAAALVAAPNPFRRELRLRPARAGRVFVLDASGRAVRSFAPEPGEVRWDGRDAAGRSTPPGLYFVRWQDAHSTRVVRVVKLAP